MCYNNTARIFVIAKIWFVKLIWVCILRYLIHMPDVVTWPSLIDKTVALSFYYLFPGPPAAAPLSGEGRAPLQHALHCHRALCAGGHALDHCPGAQTSLAQVQLETDLCWVWISAEPKPHYLCCIWACVWKSRCVTLNTVFNLIN